MTRILIFILLLLFNCTSFAQKTFIHSDIHFYVGTDSIIQDSSYNDYINYALPYLQRNINKLNSITITGYSSPEGSISTNVLLAEKRAKKVYKLINFDIENKISIYIKPGDYRYFFGENEKKYYNSMRSAVVDMFFNSTDTVYVTKHDTLFNPNTNDTVYIKVSSNCIHKPLITLKTNIILDCLPYSPFGVSFTPNISLEAYTYFWDTSIEFEYMFPWWKNDKQHKYYQIINGSLGVRKYFKGYNGMFVGVYGNTGYFDLCVNSENGWQGEHFGYGISCGYVWKKHGWRFEPYIRVGVLHTRYDIYHSGFPFNGKYYYSSYTDNGRMYKTTYIGPTMIGFNIGYDIVNFWKK